MRYTFLIISIFILGFTSCNNSKVAAENQSAKNTANKMDTLANNAEKPATTTEEVSSNTAEENLADSLFAFIHKTPCFGRCPIYKMTIYKSGYAVYEGINFVDNKGTFYTTFDSKELEEIKRIAKAIDYFQFKDEYNDPRITDIPSTITALQFDGKYKKVNARAQAPKSLQRLQTYLVNLAKNTNWKPLK